VAGSTIYVPLAPTAPVVTADDQSANEGQPVTLASVAFVDQEAAQTHRASIDWGDGSLETGLVTQANGLAGTVAGSHVYADDGSYNVEICVSDDGNPDAEGCDTLQVTVANSAPVVTILSAGSGEEGTELTLSSLVADADPVTLSWTVTLTGTTIATGMGTDLAFTPADDGVYEVALTADDGDGGNTTATGQVAIVNLAPSAAITGAPTSVTEDEVVTLGSSANDPGPTDVLTYAWAVTRDGATAATGSGPGFSFIPDLAGSYEVTLVVDDGDGATATSQVIIEVTATLQTEPVPGPGPGAEPAPEAEPVPTPEPPVSEPPAPEEAPPAENQETNQGTSNTAEEASPTLELGFAPASSDAPQLEELGLPVSPRSEPVSIVVEPETRSDQVMLLALIAQPVDDPWSDVPSTGLLLTLLWLGPTLAVLARSQLRRRAN
jgi:hypothetical protein